MANELQMNIDSNESPCSPRVIWQPFKTCINSPEVENMQALQLFGHNKHRRGNRSFGTQTRSFQTHYIIMTCVTCFSCPFNFPLRPMDDLQMEGGYNHSYMSLGRFPLTQVYSTLQTLHFLLDTRFFVKTYIFFCDVIMSSCLN